MIRVAAALRRCCADLAAEGARFAVVGGLAVSARADARLTRDVDLAVSVSNDAEAERLVRALFRRGYVTVATLDQTTAGRLATIRLRAPREFDEGVVIDLLFATSGIEAEVVAGAQALEVAPGLDVPVANAAHLIALKVLSLDDSRRPNDRADILALLGVVTEADLQETRRALGLMTSRGFDRGKDLLAVLAQVIGSRSDASPS